MKKIEQDSNSRRIIDACAYHEPDRVPSFEFYVMRRSLEYIVGRERLEKIATSEQMTHLRFLNSEMDSMAEFEEWERGWLKGADLWRDAIPGSSMTLPPEANLELLKQTAVDTASPGLTWLPKVRDRSDSSIHAYGQNGIVGDWNDIDLVRVPESRVEKMMQLVDWHLDVCAGSGVGVGPLCRSCFCNTYETMGLENFMIKLYDDRKLVERIMDIYTEYSIEIAENLSTRNIDCFWLDDDIAMNSGFLVPPDIIQELWVPRTDAMLKPLRDRGIPIYMHCCANLTDVLPIISALGVTAIHPVQPNCNDIHALKTQYQGTMAFVGNLDLAGVLAFGSPEEVMAETRQLIEESAEGGGLVVASSHSITDDVPPENYFAMIEATQRFGRYR